MPALCVMLLMDSKLLKMIVCTKYTRSQAVARIADRTASLQTILSSN